MVKLVNGKGLDIGRVFETMGFENYLCINVLGGQVGRIIENQCGKENIKCNNFWIKDENRINTAVVYEYENRMLMINEAGPVIEKEEIEDFFDFLKNRNYFTKNIREKNFLVISGSAPRGFDGERLIELIDFFRSIGFETAIDIAGDWLREIVKKSPDILKINSDEIKVAFGIDGENHLAIEEFRQIHDIDLLIITHGEKGSFAYSKKGLIQAVPIKTYSGFAVGSGDSYFAGLLKSVQEGKPIEECLKLATACGIANTLHYGAGIMTREEIASNIDNVRITKGVENG